MDERWLAWAAGIIDGEGCICLTRQNKTGQWSIRLSVANTDYRMLVKLKELLGGQIYPDRHRGPLAKRPIWRWQSLAKLAERNLKAILPWLIVKHEQAEVAILSRKYLGKQGGGKIKPNQEALAWLSAQLKFLKTPAGSVGQNTQPEGLREVDQPCLL